MGANWVVEVRYNEKKRCKIDTASAGLARGSTCLGTCDRRFSNRADILNEYFDHLNAAEP